MNRRTFLKVSFVGAIAAAIPASVKAIAKAPLPVIWSDGIHDDAEGLQAALDGRDFYCKRNIVTVTNGQVLIQNGDFFLKSAIVANGLVGTVIDRCHFVFESEYCLVFNGCSGLQITNNYLEKRVPLKYSDDCYGSYLELKS